jgi:SAM-dependent methyltransferase
MKITKTWSTPVSKENNHEIPCALCGGGNFRKFLGCEGFSYVKCNDCSLVQINPQPDPREVRLRYTDYFGDDYCNYELENEANYLNLQKLALADAGFYRLEAELMADEGGPSVAPGPKVLDIGCATGAMPAFLKERGWQALGVEISPAAEYAGKHYGLDIRGMQLEDCRFPDEYFDLALASHFIEHLNDPGGFLREVRRILRPGACLMLTTPNIGSFQARLFKNRWRSAIFDHLYLFSKKTITALLRANDFEIEGIYTWGGLAEGAAPRWLKKIMDKASKIFGFGDVMLVKAKK